MPDLGSLANFSTAVSHGTGMGAPFAYVGLGPGQEFIPYFLSLLGFVGAALVAVIQWPLFRVVRWLRSRKEMPVAVDTREAAE